jgi:hypothetical protein
MQRCNYLRISYGNYFHSYRQTILHRIHVVLYTMDTYIGATTVFFKVLLLKQNVLGRTNRLLSLIRHGPHWKRRVQQFFYCCVCIRFRRNVSTEPLPRNDKGIFTEPSRCLPTKGGYTYRHTDWWDGIYNYAVEIGAGAVIYIPSFIKIDLRVQKLTGGYTDTHTNQHTHTESNVIS